MNGRFEPLAGIRSDAVYTVSALTESVRRMVENGFPFVWVRGQVSNLTRPGSGHLYFSLQDAEAMLPVVWFKGQQREFECFDPLTGEVYAGGPKPGSAAALANGQEVICAGRLGLYTPKGMYQLQAELVREAGKSRRQMEFELLQAEFAQKGYFDPLRKRSLPAHPRRIAVITSPSGAAIHDFLRLARDRGLSAEIRIYPSLVQGEAAPAELVRALRLAGQEGWAEAAVLLRGGGSLEDLWAFNTREVAEAVHAAPMPVLCGVGHEINLSLADLIADVRAATPSHAAQLLLPDRRELAQRVDEADLVLRASLAGRLYAWTQALALQEKSLYLLSPAGRLERAEILLRAEQGRLGIFMAAKLRAAEQNLNQAGDVPRLQRALRKIWDEASARLDQSLVRLSGLDPHLPLTRGYALVRKTDGDFVRARKDAASGQRLNILLQDGVLPVRVE